MGNQNLFHTPVPRTIMIMLTLLFLLPSAFAATFTVNGHGHSSVISPYKGPGTFQSKNPRTME